MTTLDPSETRTKTFGGRHALLISTTLSWVALAACGIEEPDTAAPTDEPTIEEVRAVTSIDATRHWHGVTGLLKDIATANGPSSRWGIDTNSGTDGFRVVKWSGSQWAATPGRGIRIALQGRGDTNHDDISDTFIPWVVTSSGHIKRATDPTGNAWVPVADLPNGVLAKDIGGGSGGGFDATGNEVMWAVGQDGILYTTSGDDLGAQWATLQGSPTSVNRVSSGPHRKDIHGEVLALTTNGEIWLSNSQLQFVRIASNLSSLGPTDVSMGSSDAIAPQGFDVGSIMLTTFSPGRQVLTFDPINQTGGGHFVSTGAYPIPAPPIAVSSDVDFNRVWIVTSDNRVYYGD
jgi:hypothetical protein